MKLLLGLGISALFLYATFATVPLGQVADTLQDAQLEWIGVALFSLTIAYIFKIVRWAVMLKCLGATVKPGDAAACFLGSVAFNNVLPFRAGDIIRVVAFRRLTGVSSSEQVGTLLLERLLDLLALTTILFVTISFWRLDMLDATLVAGLRLVTLAVVLAILAFIAAPVPLRMVVRWAALRWPRFGSAGGALLRLSDAVQKLSRPGFLIKVTTLSFLAWVFEGGVFYSVGLALGVGASPEVALLALCFGTLSTIIPSSPGYVGTFHFFTARAVSVFGAVQAAAAAYALLVHAILWLTTTAIGFVLLGLVSLRGKGALASSAADLN